MEQIGFERCMFSIGKYPDCQRISLVSIIVLTDGSKDYPYDSIKEAQQWWRGVNLSPDEKEAVGRGNAIRIFKLPLES